MANDNTIYFVEKSYRLKTVGGVIQTILDERFKGSGIPLRAILEIVCILTQNGECTFFELKHGPLNRPIKLIIDKNQYDEIMTLANV